MTLQSDPQPRFAVEYHIHGPEGEARARAELLCIEQTVEAPRDLLTDDLREKIVGRVERFSTLRADCHEVEISYSLELLGSSCTQLLNVVFGISSLKPGVRVAHVLLPERALTAWPGPQFGVPGLRKRTGIPKRPLVCGVLKPLGLSPKAFAELAYQFAKGGLDLVKDDQGLMDQPFCSFEERVMRCADAVAKANRETGRSCQYLAHVSGPWDEMNARSFFAQQAGAGGLLICPGLTGYDAIRELARDRTIILPIVSHPNLLGSFYVNPDSGIAPAVLFGQLPRLVGADASIYPSFGMDFPISRDDCQAIAQDCLTSWGHLKPIFPTAAGRMSAERIREHVEVYGNHLLIILGSLIQKAEGGIVKGCERFMAEVARCTV